jgi:hypothetical protein
MHEVIQSSVSPATALAVGLKVDSAALPANFLATHDLNSPATTVELIKLNAVVGVVGTVKGTQLKSVGITCALCHSTVDNAVTTGVGNRLDGWPNRDLNPGAIIACYHQCAKGCLQFVGTGPVRSTLQRRWDQWRRTDSASVRSQGRRF